MTPLSDEQYFDQCSMLDIEHPASSIHHPFPPSKCAALGGLPASPANKDSGPGRDSYLSDRRERRQNDRHLVEIDLLRGGHSVVAAPERQLRRLGAYDYLVRVERAGQRGRFEIYRRTLRDPLPTVNIPLAGDDPEVPLRIQDAVAQVYEAGRYGDRIDYTQPCFPPLREEDHAWAAELIRPAAEEANRG